MAKLDNDLLFFIEEVTHQYQLNKVGRVLQAMYCWSCYSQHSCTVSAQEYIASYPGVWGGGGGGLGTRLHTRGTHGLLAVSEELWGGGVGCIQDENVDATKGGHSLVHYSLAVFLLRHICNDRVHIRGVL